MLRRHWRTACTAGLVLALTAMSLTFEHGYTLTAFADICQTVLLGAAVVLMVRTAGRKQGQTRIFWSLLAIGSALWTVTLGSWTWFEVFLRREIPDPFVADIVLFIHIVPYMAALALRPHRPQEEKKLYFNTLNFLILLVWWLFLYAFVVFPDEYVVLNGAVYSRSFDLLYMLENLLLLGALGVAVLSTHSGWKKIYWNLLIAFAMYTASSEIINAAISRGHYYSGSLYDIPFTASICWLIRTAVLARDLKTADEPAPPHRQWLAMAPKLAMLVLLSLPAMGMWAAFFDHGPEPIRHFRVLVTLAAILVLGVFLFLRQYLLDRELVRLLGESHKSLETLRLLHSQVVQKEKLAALGQLVAGAAHEINDPLASILGYSSLLANHGALEPQQESMVRKIGQQARRTQDLVSNLLSFAQQSSAQKTTVDLGSLLHRAVQTEFLHLERKNIKVEAKIMPALPRIWGNPNQLIQCCLQIIVNAMDAMEETGGGTLSVSARYEEGEVVLEFCDSGPGIRDPRRVFDPFYTTKPVGRGTGLGLSATYGVVQDHQGQIACYNRREGGAAFVLRFPVPEEAMPLTELAAKA